MLKEWKLTHSFSQSDPLHPSYLFEVCRLIFVPGKCFPVVFIKSKHKSNIRCYVNLAIMLDGYSMPRFGILFGKDTVPMQTC